MSLAEIRSEYDDAAREVLEKTIKAHQAKAAELADMRKSIERAEAKLAAMQEAIDESAEVEDAMAEAAARSLRLGTDVSERSDAWRAKQLRDHLIADHALLKTGFDHLRTQASGLELQAAAAHADVIAAREPIVQDMLDNLAGELSALEMQASELRARLRGFSYCGNGPLPQKLPPNARYLLGNPPRNATPPQINTPEQRKVDGDKQAFLYWKKALETDARAVLDLG